MKKVAVVMGSDSDYPIVSEAVKTLRSFDVECETRVLSAHRSPSAVAQFASGAADRGFGVIIAAAGKAAHLAGVIASQTQLPVIGIPIKSSAFEGLDALLSTVQMPAGVPVACVAVDGAKNAALLAVRILALQEPQLLQRLTDYRDSMTADIAAKDAAIQAKCATEGC
ncbi:MAG TPA: 5-(carboxyamino)imidazole ribonucleotide mutase [Clostridiales bacterium]|nr:MAG: N5-carboxyaminoimidazole ribonucleotide mutase [Firmicutes bacterium ADurb.Bin262]HOU11303.1 5-(carboxyamino)imidazole ribonucleotide mutase [Clostridiales bacterium]HQK74495.1 5-(carboxyamino)imidazole ribonucleotide mutase [Clostridiales bacterium]